MNNSFAKHFKLGGYGIGAGENTFIIAEAGVNHNGNVEIGKHLIQAASSIGASAIKFQMFHTEELILPKVAQARYQKQSCPQEDQFEMLQRLALSINEMAVLRKTAWDEGIAFICTPFDMKSLYELKDLNLDALKVASTDTTNIPFLVECCKTDVPIILSTAMSYWAEIQRAINVFHIQDKNNVAVLQCTGNYPTPPPEANLRIIGEYCKSFQCIVGFSDHTLGHIASMLAIAQGAQIIEKHLTLDKSMSGPDHKSSATPEEFSLLIKNIRLAETLLGSKEKLLTPSEFDSRNSLQKGLIFKRDIARDTKIKPEDISFVRTGGAGISPIYYHEILKMKTLHDINRGQPVKWEDLSW